MRRPRSAQSLLASVTLLLAATAMSAAGQEPPARRPVRVDDLDRLVAVSSPDVSPDGRWIAYSVTTTDVDDDERQADIWMVSWDGRERVRLTFSDDDETEPRFSPDGRFLAFLAARGDEEARKKGSQVWLLDRRGGEAEKLTDLKGGVSDLDWSPDGTRLVVVSTDGDPDDDPESKEGWKRKTAPPIVITRYHFKDDDRGYLKSLYSHLYLVDVRTRKVEALTAGPFDDSDPAFSPDGRRIAFVGARGPGDPDRDGNTDVFVVDARPGAAPVRLTTWPGPDSGRPAWSPDGLSIAYLQGDEPRFAAYDVEKLAVVPAAGGPTRVLTAALDRSVSSAHWTLDGSALVALVVDDRTEYVGRVPAAGGEVTALTAGRRVVSELARGPAGFALVAGTAGQPDEVHVLDRDGLRRVSGHNDAWLAEVELATTEDATFAAADGAEVHALLARPAGAKPGVRLPALLDIHGGPDGQSDHGFDVERELYAAAGYLVLQVNYRGSSGRGSAWQKAIYADWGHLEVLDLLAGADHLVRSGLADPQRLGIGGWSYGGILTNYAIATDRRFAAAVSGASSSLQTTMYGIDQYVAQYDLEMGPPWQTPERWLKVSYPFLHADRITTPTLFLGGEDDFNVPVAGVEQMYQALRSLGVATELVIYPGSHHVPSTPSYRRDRMTRTIDWFDRFLRPRPGAAPTPTPRPAT